MSSLIHANDEFEQHKCKKTALAGFLHHEFLNDTQKILIHLFFLIEKLDPP